jgi:hypothetical protein
MIAPALSISNPLTKVTLTTRYVFSRAWLELTHLKLRARWGLPAVAELEGCGLMPSVQATAINLSPFNLISAGIGTNWTLSLLSVACKILV